MGGRMAIEDYNELTQLIVNHIIDIPEGLSAKELMSWLKGYAQCQNDVIELIMKLKKGAAQKP
jgi:hypothetical protein